MVVLIESWRSRGSATGWDAVVGHASQIRRCQELVEALSRDPADLARLHIRIGRGLVLTGPSGSGKTLLARALATAIGRDVIVPPTAELTAATIARLYTQLARMEPVVVILDEAEGIIGHSLGGGDNDLTRALCVALDGIERPERGPVTLALTTAQEWELSSTATRPGRLAPRLDLSLPTYEERLLLLERAVDGVPTEGPIDLPRVAERTASWTGAELVTAIEEAMLRSLPERIDALREDLLLQVVRERYVIDDEPPLKEEAQTFLAEHEAGHAIYAELVFPGRVAVLKLSGSHGQTLLSEELSRLPATADRLRRMAGVALAGMAAEELLDRNAGPGDGSILDLYKATQLLMRRDAVTSFVDVDAFEDGSRSDRGSERMRAALHARVEQEAAALKVEVSAALAPYLSGIRRLAAVVLAAPEQALSGEPLQAAIADAMSGPDLRGQRS